MARPAEVSGGAGRGADLDIELTGEIGEHLDSGVRRRMVGAAEATLDRLGVGRGHVAIEVVDAARIHELNREHRAKDAPTDVLSFPVDAEGVAAGKPLETESGTHGAPIEIGDVVICPEHTEDLVEATVHGVLHLCGFDHENDDGEMLALQDEIVDSLADGGAPPRDSGGERA